LAILTERREKMYKHEKGIVGLEQVYESLLDFKGEDMVIECMCAIDEFHYYSCNLVFERELDDWNKSYVFFNVIVDGWNVNETEKVFSIEDFDKLEQLFDNARYLFNEKVREGNKKGNRKL
jgi:hypothetical protein